MALAVPSSVWRKEEREKIEDKNEGIASRLTSTIRNGIGERNDAVGKMMEKEI